MSLRDELPSPEDDPVVDGLSARRARAHAGHGSTSARRPLVRATSAETPSPLPAPWAGGHFATARPWWRRPVAWSVAVGLVLGLVAGLIWVSSGGPTDQRARLAHAATFTPPTPLLPGTAYVRTRVLRSGDLEVTQWIASDTPVQELTLRAPRVPGLSAGALTVGHVVVATNGGRSTATPVADPPPGVWQYRIAVANTVYLRYRLSGAVRTSGAQGRTRAVVTALFVTTGTPLTSTTQTVVGGNVSSLGCSFPSLSTTPVPCGTTSNGTSTVRLDDARQQTRVSAQVDP